MNPYLLRQMQNPNMLEQLQMRTRLKRQENKSLRRKIGDVLRGMMTAHREASDIFNTVYGILESPKYYNLNELGRMQ